MGFYKQTVVQLGHERKVAQKVAIDAGIAKVCEFHDEEILADWLSEEQVQETYKLAGNPIKSRKLKLLSTVSELAFREMIKPQCERITFNDD
jgi:hypothetical protein